MSGYLNKSPISSLKLNQKNLKIPFKEYKNE